MVTAIGVADALRGWEPSLDVRIKWPNDLWIGNQGAKLGGILCEAVGNPQGSFVVVGIGLNCLHAPSGLDQSTASLSSALGGEGVTADHIRDVIINGVLNAYSELQVYGTATLLARYEAWAAIAPGAEIEWTQLWAGQSQDHYGVVQGLGKSGELLVRTGNGEVVPLFAEDVKIRAARKAGGGSLL
jgi:BirA family biotin operon repressor/biotin-[acetyl-CoA-carboxylase] ligase